MPLRRDIPSYLQINLSHFQKFDRGEEILQFLPSEWNLQPGDLMEWECDQRLHGIARIVACKPKVGKSMQCAIQKES